MSLLLVVVIVVLLLGGGGWMPAGGTRAPVPGLSLPLSCALGGRGDCRARLAKTRVRARLHGGPKNPL